MRAEEEAVPDPAKQQRGAPTPTSPWENKGQAPQKPAGKATGRKTSNLPA